MARGMYVGVNGVPKKMSKMYIGVKKETPIYSDGELITLDNTNISEYFSITDGTYGFVWNDTDNAFSSNNGGVHNSTATSTWTALKDMKNITLNYSYSSEAKYDKFTLTIAGKTIENAVSGATTIKSWSGDILAGQTIVLTYKKDSSASSNDDKCKIYNIKYDTRVLLGTKVEELARTVKKAYIGVNGIAKKIFPPYKILEYKGTATPLSGSNRYWLSATTVGNYALFGGGEYSSKVDVYDTKLTKTNATDLSVGGNQGSATTVGDYALFGGGNYYSHHSTVDAYDTKLTRSSITDLSDKSCSLMGATTVGNYALFAGGYGYDKESSSSTYSSKVDAYDTKLTKTNATNLSVARNHIGATTVGNYALFGGGSGGGYYSSKVDAYDTKLTKTNATDLSVGGYQSATTVGDYALFTQGLTVDAYDSSLTKTTVTNLSVERDDMGATTVGDYALFAGGCHNNDNYSTVDTYDTKLTKSSITDLSVARSLMGATTVGNYALFGGGRITYTNMSNSVDIYQCD